MAAIKIRQLHERIQEVLAFFSDSGKTQKLWVQYFKMVELIRSFIRAERLSDFLLHMRTVADILPYLAAGGHGQYAKAARLYFVTKYIFCHQQHTVCYSTAKWTGIWTDLGIEQTLMRYCKSCGGLSRGRLRSESSQKLWLLNLVHTTKVNQLLMEHLESGRSRPEHPDLLQRGRDLDCVKKIFTWFGEKSLRNTDSTKLVPFSTGLVSWNGHPENSRPRYCYNEDTAQKINAPLLPL